ncbi:hypothetical protein TSUD_372660 [Trifolium subterraneum]|uniref:Myb/SANT-like domain-containing protein n=1 Tax=Trifolium subterraneum TaxID=3900 RepID=A0A2Z6NGI3_TRISU|nr:hypothetical protein TSUD_372660 [Trifolium subterraneum]
MEYIIFITLIFFTNFTKCSSTTNTTNTTITTTTNNNFTATSIPPMAKQEINNIIDALIGTGDTSINKWENVKYAKFRHQGLEFRDELEFIFGEIVATSQTAWTPSMGVPLESTGKHTTADVAHEIIESDDEFNIDDLSPVRNTQSKNKRKVSPKIVETSTRGKTKIGTAPTMRKTLERLVEAAEGHNEVEKAEIEARSHVNGQYSIPACVAILKTAKEEGFLNGQQFIYALELLKDEQNRVLMISLKESMNDLIDWILFKYK